MSARAVFFYDFNSPYAWLAAERIESVLAEPPVWTPISYAHVIQHTGVLPWSMKPGRETDMREVERRAAARGLEPVRWPEGWPRYSTLAVLRAATFAIEIGKGGAFSLAAFRQQFNGGRPLSDLDTVVRAGAACGLDATLILEASSVQRSSVRRSSSASGRRPTTRSSEASPARRPSRSATSCSGATTGSTPPRRRSTRPAPTSHAANQRPRGATIIMLLRR